MADRDDLYTLAAAEFGAPLARLVRAYESHPEHQRDLLQDVHLALWRSLASFNGRCSLRTWTYRVAHNVVISTRLRRRHRRLQLVSLEELAGMSTEEDVESNSGERQLLERLHLLIRSLEPPDDQVMVLYLEDLDATVIGEITGLSPGAVSTRVHRAKALLARHFRQDEST